MPNVVHDYLAVVAGLGFVVVIYGWNYWCRGALSRWLLPWTGLQQTMPLRSAEFLVRVPLYSIPGIVVYIVLALLYPTLIIPTHFNIERIVTGVVLGLGFVAAGITFSQGIYLITKSFENKRNKRKVDAFDEISGFGDTGWIRGYTIARKILPRISYILIAVSIIGEELGFRGVVLPLLIRGLGPIPGLILATAAFVGIQKMNMPTWRIALIPMSSALLIGYIQGYLALTNLDMLPLIVSHYSFFIISTSIFNGVGVSKESKLSRENKSMVPSWSRPSQRSL